MNQSLFAQRLDAILNNVDKACLNFEEFPES